MKKTLNIIFTLLFLILPLLTLSIIVQGGYTINHNQNEVKNPNKKKRQRIEQSVKELTKTKKLKVKVRRKYSGFFRKNNSYPTKMVLVEEVYFDEKGNRTKHIRYKSTSEVDLEYDFRYDSNGNLITMDTYDGYGNLRARKESKYDKNNNEILRKLQNSRNSEEIKSEFQYDNQKRLIKTINYSQKSEIISTQYNEYDGDLLVKSIIKDVNDNQLSEIIYEYNAEGYVIKETKNSSKGVNVINYKYDSKGNLVEITDNETKRELKYDSNGNLIEDKLYLSDGTRQFRVTFSYYSNGLQKEEIRYSNDDNPAFVAKYEYEFYQSR